ncbi:MAG: hypothetical protein CSH36_01100 [Thalassolituus sp.]|nr:MAG: hypothetical protein CSH36_01100 [Thalassolituus sp.]
MKTLNIFAVSVVSVLLLSGCSDDVERTELQKAYAEARAETKAAIEQTKDAIDSMEDNQAALEKVLKKLNAAMEKLGEESSATEAPAAAE